MSSAVTKASGGLGSRLESSPDSIHQLAESLCATHEEFWKRLSLHQPQALDHHIGRSIEVSVYRGSASGALKHTLVVRFAEVRSRVTHLESPCRRRHIHSVIEVLPQLLQPSNSQSSLIKLRLYYLIANHFMLKIHEILLKYHRVF